MERPPIRPDYTEPQHTPSNRFHRRTLLDIVSLDVPAVFLFATLDTKGREAAFVRDLLASWDVPVTLVDVGALGSPAVAADIPRERSLRAGWNNSRSGPCSMPTAVRR